MAKSEPWYLHAGLYTIVVILIIILIKVAIIDPKEVLTEQTFDKKESRLRMHNLKEAEILYQKKFGRFSGNIDTLINFIKTDKMVDSVMVAVDSITNKSSNPFSNLSDGKFTPDSLYRTPGSQQMYIVQVDTSMNADTVINRSGKILRIDSTVVIGSRYYIEDPDGYGTIGSLDNDALKNTASWE
jgi:hypothetical protein